MSKILSFPTIDYHFTFADQRRMQKVMNVMDSIAKEETNLGEFFRTALDEFWNAPVPEKVEMCKYLLEIYNDTKECGCMTLEQAVILSAYPA